MNVEERLNNNLRKTPVIPKTAYVDQSAELVGNITLGDLSSILPQCVLSGDINSIKIDIGSNVHDGTIVHLSDGQGLGVGN